MKQCWKDLGLTEEGAKRADAAIADLVRACETIGSRETARRVFDEAIFRAFYLPEKSEQWRARYMEENG